MSAEHPFTGDPDALCDRCRGALEHPDHGDAPLGPEWRPDGNRPGYFFDPARPGWLRDARGHWYAGRTIDAIRREVESVADVEQIALDEQDSFERRFRRRLRETRQ